MRLNADACVSSDEKLYNVKPIGEVTPQSGRVWIGARGLAQEDCGGGTHTCVCRSFGTCSASDTITIKTKAETLSECVLRHLPQGTAD